MTESFEFSILQYLCRDRDGMDLLEAIPESFFGNPVHMLVLSTLKEYHKEYGAIPKESNLMQFFKDMSQASGLDPEIFSMSSKIIRRVYGLEMSVELVHFKARIVRELQTYKTRKLIADNMDNLENMDNVFEVIHTEMRRIVELKNTLFDSSEARFVLKDFDGFKHLDYRDVITYPFQAMNDLTAAGGIFPPQLIVALAPAKGFKTGLMVNMAYHCLVQGKKVFYADFENGETDIINRVYCKILQKTYSEMMEQTSLEQLRDAVKFAGIRGGDIYVKSYEMFKGTPAQVDIDIERLRSDGWACDIIFWDYVDIARPSDSYAQRQDKRLRIQAVYGEVKNINKKYKISSVTPSHTNRDSIGKHSYSARDLAEDIGKAANSDGIWAVVQTPEEAVAKVARIQNVLQRKGVEFTGSEWAYVRVDKSRQHMEEITREEYEEFIGDAGGDSLEGESFTAADLEDV